MARDYSNVKQFDGKAPVKVQDTPTALTKILQANMRQLTSVLPKHITPERMARVSLSTIRRNPKLCECAPETLFMAIIEASTLGLEIDSRGLAYLVPFKNKKTQTYDVQLMPGYKGMVDLAYRSGKVQSIQAAVVGENDKFDYALGLKPRLEHVPNLKGRGQIIAAYAVAIMKDGAAQFEVMSLEELEKVRNSSQARDYGPWVDWTDQMYIKTVLKRLCKLLPLSPEIQRAVVLDDAVDAGVAQVFGETLDQSLLNIPAPEVTPAPAIEQQSSEAAVEMELAPEPEKEPVATQPATKQEQSDLMDTSYTFKCPANGKEVTEETCKGCKDRKGCPQWDA